MNTCRIKIKCLYCDKSLGEIEYIPDCCNWDTVETKPLCNSCFGDFLIMVEALTKIRIKDEREKEDRIFRLESNK